MYHVIDRQRVSLSRVRRPAGLGLGVRGQPLRRRRDHVPRLASGEHPGVRHRRARSEGSRHRVRQRAHERLALRPHARARRRRSGPTRRHAAERRRDRTATCARCRSHWSPVDPTTLFYASNVVWKTHDRGHSWTRISARSRRARRGQCRRTPASTRAPSSPRPLGSITALAPSPRSRSTIIWAGTDDGNIQVTTRRRREVDQRHAAAIKPWTRIFNIDAGHFDTAHRVRRREHDAPRRHRTPHFWRTHDGGKTWTEINTGIAAGRRRQLDSRGSAAEGTALRRHRHAGVGVVRRWRSLAVAAAQHAGDLGARPAGEGRRDVPLRGSDRRHARPRLLDSRQRDAAASGGGARRPRSRRASRICSSRRRRCACASAPTIRRRGRPSFPPARIRRPARSSTTTSPQDASGPVKLEILDAAGKVVRTYSSTEPVLDPDPGKDMAAYDEVCKQTPTAPDCALPLYWPAPQIIVSTEGGHASLQLGSALRSGLARRSDSRRRRGGDRRGAAAARIRTTTCRGCRRARYTVRLTVDGVDEDAADRRAARSARARSRPTRSTQLNTLSTDLYWEAVAAHHAFNEARELAATLGSRSGAGRRRQERTRSARADRTAAQRARASPARRRACDAVARSGQQRVAGGGDGDAVSRGGADGRAGGGGGAARRRRSASWRAGPP